jgi:hypothetical protein
MFTKLAQISVRGVGSTQRASATTDGYRASNAAVSRPANPHRVRRPMLICHWRHAPVTGALECVWESVTAPATGQPRPQRSLGEVRRLPDARAATKSPFRRAAA